MQTLIDVPGWRARILELMRATGLPDADGPLVLDALAADLVAAERHACVKIIEKALLNKDDALAWSMIKQIRARG
jgi:uncharacterized membrane protein (DUF2068 family)